MAAENQGISFESLRGALTAQEANVKEGIKKLQDNKDGLSVGDMFKLQFESNTLSSLSEASTSLTSAVHQAKSSVARNVK